MSTMEQQFSQTIENPTPMPVLATKLYVPHHPAKLISRYRLIERMDLTLSKKVTIISAPAGFGKSTLISEWIHRISVPVGWISLDHGENNCTQFWTYVIAALQRVKSGAGRQAVSLMQSPLQPSIDTLISLLVNDLQSISEDFVLILDDFHLIENAEVHRSFANFLERIPARMHICLASRKEIPLSLGNMRMRGLLNEIGIADMRFTSEEISTFWEHHVGATLSETNLHILEQRTEGWIAGLQLASLYRKDQTTGDSHAIQSFSGKYRYVVDYLMEEVFIHLPEDIQSFLLQTSLLEQMNSSLCLAVTGLTERDYLEWLEKANLFLIPLDAEQYWYRYHHLFADFLKNRMKQAPCTSIPELHQKASEWLEQNDYLEQAIDHALLALNVERAANLIVKNASKLFSRREITLLRCWLEQLPENLRSRYDLLIIHCWTELLGGNITATQTGVGMIREKLVADAQVLPPIDLSRIYSEITVLLNFIVLINKDFDGAIQLMNQLVARTEVNQHGKSPNDEILINIGVELNTGDASVSKGFWGFCGRIKQAEIYHDLFHQFIDKNHLQDYHYAANNFTILGEIYYEKNDREKALEFTQKALRVAYMRKNVGAFVPANLTIARIHRSRGEYEFAISQIETAKAQLNELSELQPQWLAIFQAFLAQCHLLMGDEEGVEDWRKTSHVHIDRDVTVYQEFENLTLLRVLIFRSSYDEALLFSKRLLQAAINEDRTGNILENRLLQAVILFRMDAIDQAIRQLHEALMLAEMEGYMRTVLDERLLLKELLKNYIDMRKNRYLSDLQKGVSIRYLEKLFAAMTEEGLELDPLVSDSTDVSSLLTKRELEVLQQLSQGLPTKQIAENLSLTVGTVKLHLNRIYHKLNCSNRLQAIQKAEILGLV